MTDIAPHCPVRRRAAGLAALRPPRARDARRRASAASPSIELMVAITLSLLLLLGLSAYFVSSSSSFSEADRVSRQIENGRYAMHILSEEIRHAGFYGESASFGTAAGRRAAGPVQHDARHARRGACRCRSRASTSCPARAIRRARCPSCVPGHVDGTDVLVIRRAQTTTIPAASAVSGGLLHADQLLRFGHRRSSSWPRAGST